MTVSATLASGDSAPLPNTSAIPAFIFPSETGAGSVFQFDPGDDVHSSIGASAGSESVYWFLRNAKQPCVVGIATGTPGSKSAIVHVGSGPTVTASYTGGIAGPLVTASIGVKVIDGGLNGAASVGYFLDGSGDFAQYAAPIPQEAPAVLVGDVDLTGLTLSTLNATTLVFSAPAALTVTFVTPTSVQDIADQINAQAITATTVHRAELYETADDTFLRLYTTTSGVGVTMTINHATSTGEAILGFSVASANVTTTGAAATLPLAFTGITLTFAAGTYIANDTYTMTTTGPTASTSALSVAAAAVRSSDYPFGYIAPLIEASTASNSRGICDMLDALVTTWDTDDEAAIFPIQLTPGHFHVASTSAATSATNIATADQALLAAFANQVSFGTVVPGDGYRVGTKLTGSYRAPALLGVAYMLSAFRLSDDPGAATHGAIPEWSLMAPDGVTMARDQANPRTVNKLGGSRGPGYTVLSTVLGVPRVKRGVTRAGLTSRLVDLGPGLRMGRRGQQILYQTAKNGVENQTYQTGADGRLLEGVRRALEGAFEADLGDALLTPPENLNASSVDVEIVSSEVIANTSNITVKATLQKLGSAENVTIRAFVAGTVVSTTLA